MELALAIASTGLLLVQVVFLLQLARLRRRAEDLSRQRLELLEQRLRSPDAWQAADRRLEFVRGGRV